MKSGTEPGGRRTCISLFAGAGISDVGFHRAGWDCVAQVEIDKTANNVRRRHFPDAAHFEDIRSFDAKQFRGVDCVFGGFPCQDYSVAGKRAGVRGDQGALWWDLHRVLGECRPPFVGLENVPGLLSSGDGVDLYDIVSSLVELGYSIAWRVLNLRYFGVPQRRRRVLIVGHLGGGRAGEILFEPSCLSRHIETGREAGEEDSGDVAGCLRGRSNLGQSHAEDLDTYLPIQARSLCGTGVDCDPDQSTLIAGTLGANTGGMTRPAGNTNELDFCIPICDVRRGSHADANRPSFGDPDSAQYTLQADKQHGVAVAFAENSRSEIRTANYSPQITTGGGKPGQGFPAVQQGWRVRRLTPREAERLMGLEDDFTRWGECGKEIADGPRYKMIGNGWSVPQAEWLARRILEVMS